MPTFSSLLHWVLVVMATLGIGALLLYAGGFAWIWECESPSDDAARVLVPAVRFMVVRQLASTGRVGDIDAELRSRPHHIIGLDNYRVRTRKVSTGYEITIKPRWLCLCRASYILRDGGRKLEIERPLLSFGR